MQSSDTRRRKLVLRRTPSHKRFPAIGQRLIRKISDLDLLLRPLGVQINLEPSDYARGLFCRLSLATQRKIVSTLDLYFKTLQELRDRKQDPWDSLRFAWSFLKNARLHPHSRLFERVSKDDVLEVYNRDMTQIFRNLQFLSSYDIPLFDLIVLDRMTVLRSEARLEEKLFLKLDSALRQNKGSESFNTEACEWFERFGDSNVYRIHYQTFGSLMARGRRPSKVEAVIVSSQVERISSVPRVSPMTAA